MQFEKACSYVQTAVGGPERPCSTLLRFIHLQTNRAITEMSLMV